MGIIIKFKVTSIGDPSSAKGISAIEAVEEIISEQAALISTIHNDQDGSVIFESETDESSGWGAGQLGFR